MAKDNLLPERGEAAELGVGQVEPRQPAEDMTAPDRSQSLNPTLDGGVPSKHAFHRELINPNPVDSGRSLTRSARCAASDTEAAAVRHDSASPIAGEASAAIALGRLSSLATFPHWRQA